MSVLRGRTVPVLLAAVVLVGGANLAAYAANGKPFLLGKSNAESSTASLKNGGSGPALALSNKSSSPPLTVTSDKKVTHLNADSLDGKDSSQLASTVYRYVLPNIGPLGVTEVSFPGLPKGVWNAQYAITVSYSSAVSCWFHLAGDTHPGYGLSTSGTSGFDAFSSAALLDSRGSKGPITLRCSGSSFSFYSKASDVYSVVWFTSVTSVTDHEISTARNPAPGH